MEVGQIVILILSIVSLLLGGKLIKLRNLIKEVKDIFPVLDDVLSDQVGESQQEKLSDLRQLRLECREAVNAIKAMFKK